MDQRRKFYLIFAAIIFILIIFAIYISNRFISTILLSFLMAYILHPFFIYFSRYVGRHRQISALASILIIFFILIFVIFAAADALIIEMSNLLDLGGLTYLQMQASNFSSTIISFSETYLPALAADYVRGIGDIPTALILMVQPVLQDHIINLASSIPIFFTQFLLAIIFTYYFLVDGKRITDEFIGLLPEKDVTARFRMELDLIYGSLFRVFFLNSLIIGVIAATGFLVIGVPYPLLLGMIIAVAALVPMLGPELVFGPIALYYLLTQDYARGLALLAFGIIFLTVIPNNFILPRLASASASIHPLITLMAFTAPIFVIGLIGVIVGPAVFGFILAAYRTMVHFRKATFEAEAESSASSMPMSKSPEG